MKIFKRSLPFPSRDDNITADNRISLVEVFVPELDQSPLGFVEAVPEAMGRPASHPSMLFRGDFHGYLSRVPVSV